MQNIKRIGILLAVIIFVWLIVKACSSLVHEDESTYKVARDETWHPASLYGKEKNMLGFTNELLIQIGNEENFRVQLLNRQYSNLFLGLENGEYEGVLSSLLPTSANKNRYLFSEPLYLLGPVLVIQKGKPYHTIEEFEGHTVAFRRGDPLDIDFSKYPGITLRVYDSYAAAVEALTRDRIDAILIDAIPAYNTIQGFYANKMSVATKPLNNSGIRLITLKNGKGEKLIRAFNEGLAKLKESGEIKQLLNAWQLIDTETLAN